MTPPALAAARAALEAGDLQQAFDAATAVLRLRPGDPEASHLLGQVFLRAGDLQQAHPHLQRAAESPATRAAASTDLAELRLRTGDVAAAFQHFELAVKADPRHLRALIGLASVRYASGDCEAAADWARQALDVSPSSPEALEVCSLALHFGGRADEALGLLKHAHAQRPDDTNLLQLMIFPTLCAEHDPTAAFELHAELGRRLAAQVPPDPRRHTNTRDPERRLNIGYFSRDYQSRWGPRFYGPVIAGHDRSQFEVFCYYASDAPDELRLRPSLQSTTWTNTLGMSDDDFARRVRADQIDILIDLSGYTMGTRLAAFCRRPAPLQGTYLGYPSTTGLKAIDFRIVDWITDPKGSEPLATEELVRLDGCFLCPRLGGNLPDITPPPSSTRGTVTFGSFNTLSKIGERVLALWSRILRETPGSRLLLKNLALGQPSVCARVRRDLESLGIDPSRIELRAETPSESDHLRMYSEIDIALDPYPYNGTTTTFDALVMGVPVVTLLGNSHIARVGASLLAAAGLPDLIAQTEDEYVQIATILARDREGLKRRRATQRNNVAASALCDQQAFSRGLDARLRGQWRRWCTDSLHTPPTTTR